VDRCKPSRRTFSFNWSNFYSFLFLLLLNNLTSCRDFRKHVIRFRYKKPKIG